MEEMDAFPKRQRPKHLVPPTPRIEFRHQPINQNNMSTAENRARWTELLESSDWALCMKEMYAPNVEMLERADNGTGDFGQCYGVDPKDGGHHKREEQFFAACKSKTAKVTSMTVTNGGRDVFVVYDMKIEFTAEAAPSMGGPGFEKTQGTLVRPNLPHCSREPAVMGLAHVSIHSCH